VQKLFDTFRGNKGGCASTEVNRAKRVFQRRGASYQSIKLGEKGVEVGVEVMLPARGVASGHLDWEVTVMALRLAER
jgi:hypothetical protein